MIWLKWLAQLVKLISEGENPRLLAGGAALGFCLGLVPGWPLHLWPVIIILLLFNFNLAMAGLGSAVALALAWLLDAPMESLGDWVLTGVPALQGLWTTLYNSEMLAFTRFNNTLVMGTSLSALVLTPLFYFLILTLLVQYKEKLAQKFSNSSIGRLIKGSKFFGVYQRVKRAELI